MGHGHFQAVAAHKVGAVGIQQIGEPHGAALLGQFVHDLVGGHAQGHRAEARLVTAQVALAFFDLQLGAHPAVFAEPQHDHPAAVHRNLQRGGAALVAGGLGLFIGNIVAAALLHELAAGHQLHKLFFFLILHRLVDVLFDAALDADALILVTEWKEFRLPTWGVIKKAMKQPVVLDGRNIYDGDELQEMGFVYHCIGR